MGGLGRSAVRTLLKRPRRLLTASQAERALPPSTALSTCASSILHSASVINGITDIGTWPSPRHVRQLTHLSVILSLRRDEEVFGRQWTLRLQSSPLPPSLDLESSSTPPYAASATEPVNVSPDCSCGTSCLPVWSGPRLILGGLLTPLPREHHAMCLGKHSLSRDSSTLTTQHQSEISSSRLTMIRFFFPFVIIRVLV
jgi:hypothetical protein